MHEIADELRQSAGAIAADVAGQAGWDSALPAPLLASILLRVADHVDERDPAPEHTPLPGCLRDSLWVQGRLAAALAAALHARLPEAEAIAAVISLRAVLRALLPREPLNGQEQLVQELHAHASAGLFPAILSTLEDAGSLAWMITMPSGTLLHLSSASHRALGYGAAELRLGLSWADLLAPESQEDAARALAAAAGTPQQFPATFLDRGGRRSNWQIDLRPLKGHPLMLVLLSPPADSAASGLVDLLMDHAPAAIVVTDEQDRILRANPKAAELYGAPSVAALAGQQLIGSDGSFSREGSESLYSRVGQHPAIMQYTFRFTSVFGKEVYFEASIIPVRQEGNAPGLVLFLDDLYQRHIREESIRQSDRLPTLMGIIGGVAHELNNPLTTILGYAELLLSSASDPAMKNRLASIGQEAQRCKTIVENLQSFGLQLHRDKTLCDINGLVREAVELQEYQLRIDEVDITLQLASDLPQLLLQERDIRRLCLSIVVNAHRALQEVTDRPRQLRIATQQLGTQVHLSFRDSGIGMTSETRHRAFEPFFTTQPRGAALGLGLSVAYGIVQQHQGRIWIESAVNEGTTVHIELPAPIFDA